MSNLPGIPWGLQFDHDELLLANVADILPTSDALKLICAYATVIATSCENGDVEGAERLVSRAYSLTDQLGIVWA